MREGVGGGHRGGGGYGNGNRVRYREGPEGRV